MKHLTKYNLFESKDSLKISVQTIEDIEDMFLTLKDDGFKVYKEDFFLYDDKEEAIKYDFLVEFIVYKSGNSGYYLDHVNVGLFDIEEVMDSLNRFHFYCEDIKLPHKILANDGEFLLDITSKLDNLNDVSEYDSIHKHNVHFKKKKGVDLTNLKFISCQIMKNN